MPGRVVSSFGYSSGICRLRVEQKFTHIEAFGGMLLDAFTDGVLQETAITEG